jgi:PAS domain S-box-containing protein
MRNLNKLFPRFSIRSKLAVAFALLATTPLLIVSAVGMYSGLRRIEASASTSLNHDLVTAQAQTERSLGAAVEDLVFLSEMHFRAATVEPVDFASLESTAEAFLKLSTVFFQIKLFAPDGESMLVTRAAGLGSSSSVGASGGAYYTMRARGLERGQHLLLPVEIRGVGDGGGGVEAIPAIAVVYPLRDDDDRLLAVAVGEAYASELFESLEYGSPQLAGVTGLIDGQGQFLYHSERKSDWNTLLANDNLNSDFESNVAQQILAGTPGSVRTSQGTLVSVVPLDLVGPDGQPLLIYRVVPTSLFDQPARLFRRNARLGSLLVLLVAIGLAFMAANQFTRPIYQLREGARSLAAGEFDHELDIETNDELEDLAAEFSRMANRLEGQQEILEDEVAQRTAALQEAHAELEEIFANSDDAILRLDPNGRVQVWNRGAEKIFGYTKSEASGRAVYELLMPPGEAGRQKTEHISKEVKRTGALLNYQTTLLREDRNPVDVSLSQTIIQGDSQEPLGHTLIIRDVTQQKAFEKQLLKSERLAAAGRLAAGVAHEINNPIGIAVNRLDCLELEMNEQCAECFAREDLQVVRAQTERVGEVARRLLSIARSEPARSVSLDLSGLVGGVIAFLQPGLEKRGLEFEWDLSVDLPTIKGSPQGLESMAMNLLLNAADASRPGETIRVATRAVNDGRKVELEITDTGTGISPDLMDRIFEPFFTTKVEPLGTGLGLAVTRAIVEDHSGEIRVESQPSEGSRFIVTLPVEAE